MPKSRAPLSVEQAHQQFVTGDAVMSRYGGKDGRQGADTQRIVVGNRDVMFAVLLRHQAKVAAGLPRYRVAEPFEAADQLLAGEIARYPHAASASSLVM